MEEMIQTGDSDNGVYEIGFILSPNITEEKLPEAFGALKNVLSEKGAVTISEEFPKLMTLAYTMEKTINNKIERFTEGYFGWIKFELPAEVVAPLEGVLRLREDLVRYLLISTVRENTVASKRIPSVRRRVGGKDDISKEAAPEMSKEQIDREIEALVDDKAVA